MSNSIYKNNLNAFRCNKVHEIQFEHDFERCYKLSIPKKCELYRDRYHISISKLYCITIVLNFPSTKKSLMISN